MSSYFSSGFVVREPAWHREATVVEEALNAPEAIRMAGADWLVVKESVYMNGWEDARKKVEVPSQFVTRRADTGDALGIVGEGYEVIQNGDLFRFFDNVFDREEGRYYHTGGTLKGGKIVWLLAKVPGDFYLPGTEDVIDNYLLLASSHDGSISFTAKHTPIRVVCWNTLSVALKGTQTAIKIRHTKSARQQIQEASKALGFAQRNNRVLEKVAQELVARRMNTRGVKQFLTAIFPSSREPGEKVPAQTMRKRERVELLFTDGETNNLPGIERTAWALYNATTEFVDHDWDTRAGTDKLHRTWFGAGETLKRKAQRVLVEYARTGEIPNKKTG